MTSSHVVVWKQGGTRIVCLVSSGHVDQQITCQDVLICGTHSAEISVELVLPVRPRGFIGHSAGPGLDSGGVSGLPLLDIAGIPGAAVDGATAPIGDGLQIWEFGVLSHVNVRAATLGIKEGMRVCDAAIQMASKRLPPAEVPHHQLLLHEQDGLRIIGLDTMKAADNRIEGMVICTGTHCGMPFADYLEPFGVRGVITNDVGLPIGGSATSGFSRLDERRIPAAVVENESARVGDGASTYETGVISTVNETAHGLGIAPGMKAEQAAKLMLAEHSGPA